MEGPYEFRDGGGGRVRHQALTRAGSPIPWAEAWRLLHEDAAFRTTLLEALREAPFEACFWETPPLDRRTRERPCEWVLVDAPSLAGVPPDERAFSEHLDVSTGVRAFPNLSGDALLVAPCRGAAPEVYAHLLTFVRGAPSEQAHALLSAVGSEVEAHLAASEATVWVSTSGLGVYWLHVRLDARPKYYTHAPYRAT